MPEADIQLAQGWPIRTKPSRLICFTGIDGSGKSTQIQLLAERLRSQGHDVAVVWTGGKHYITRNVIRMVKRRLGAPRLNHERRFEPNPNFSGSVTEQWNTYTAQSSSLARKHPLFLKLWTHVSLMEHALEAQSNIIPHLLRGKLVLSDRYLYRSLVNLAILIDAAPDTLRPLLRHPAFRLVPRPMLYLLLDIPADVALARKHDIPVQEHVERRVPIYRWLASETGMPVIDASRNVEAVAEALWSVIAPALAAYADGSRSARPPF